MYMSELVIDFSIYPNPFDYEMAKFWLNIFKKKLLSALSPLNVDTYEWSIKFNKWEFEYHFKHMNYLKINYRISDLDLEHLTEFNFKALGSINFVC